MGHHKLPIIDFTNNNVNLKPGSSSWFSTSNNVKNALENYGCFIAVYDNVSMDLHSTVFRASKDLFDLPTETKVQNKSNKPLSGYAGQNPASPLYESMAIDLSTTPKGVQSFTNVMWPNGNLSFSETLLSYTKLAAELEQMVMRLVFGSYGIEKYYNSYLESAIYITRVIKYRAPDNNEINTGLVPHTDRSFMTVIQSDQVNGLEVKARNGEWFNAYLPPSTFIVMAGDAAMAWSNNRIHAPHHRVIMNVKKERYSIAQFTYMKEIVETPKEFVDDEHPLEFKPFDHFGFLESYSKKENRGFESPIRTYCGV